MNLDSKLGLDLDLDSDLVLVSVQTHAASFEGFLFALVSDECTLLHRYCFLPPLVYDLVMYATPSTVTVFLIFLAADRPRASKGVGMLEEKTAPFKPREYLVKRLYSLATFRKTVDNSFGRGQETKRAGDEMDMLKGDGIW